MSGTAHPPALQAYQAFVQAVVHNSDRGICPVCSYLWQECECGVAAPSVWASFLAGR